MSRTCMNNKLDGRWIRFCLITCGRSNPFSIDLSIFYMRERMLTLDWWLSTKHFLATRNSIPCNTNNNSYTRPPCWQNLQSNQDHGGGGKATWWCKRLSHGKNKLHSQILFGSVYCSFPNCTHAGSISWLAEHTGPYLLMCWTLAFVSLSRVTKWTVALGLGSRVVFLNHCYGLPVCR